MLPLPRKATTGSSAGSKLSEHAITPAPIMSTPRGSIAGSADGVRQLREYGANFLALGTDMMLLQNALQARLDEVRI